MAAGAGELDEIYSDDSRSMDDHGCEIYVIRTDGTELRRLTNNEYCDYQPRWGP